MMPTETDVLTYLGETSGVGQDVDQISAHVESATAMVKAYTRDRGFDPVTGEPGDDLAAVIVSCAARSYRNPTKDRQMTAGPFSTSPGVFQGWTLSELAILHRHRARAR